MSKKPLFIGAVASIIAINSVFANTIVTSQTYVDNADALKQDIITTGLVDFEHDGDDINGLSALVSYDTTSGVVGNKYGILPTSAIENWPYECDSAYCYPLENADNLIPTVGMLAQTAGELAGMKQSIIPGKEGDVVMMFPDYDGMTPRSRKIFDGSATYNSTQNATNIPTMGAVMAAIGANGLPSATDNQVLQYTNGAWISVTMDSAPTASSTKPVTSGGVYTAVSAKQNKMTCTRWLDNADETDEHCLLWSMAN